MIYTLYSLVYTIGQVSKDKIYTYVYSSENKDVESDIESGYVYVERMRKKPLSESIYDHVSAPFIHVTEIDDKIYLGNAYNAADYYYLKSKGITGIVNASKEISNYFEDYDKDIQYFKLEDVKDINNSSISKYFDPFLEFIVNTTKNNGRVLIHCFMGSSRSAILVVLYLIKYKNFKLEDSINYITKKRFRVNINKTFINELKDYMDEKKIEYK